MGWVLIVLLALPFALIFPLTVRSPAMSSVMSPPPAPPATPLPPPPPLPRSPGADVEGRSGRKRQVPAE